MADYEELKAQLLFKLYRKGKWGGAHTPLKNLFHLMDNSSIKDSKKAIRELLNLGMIFVKISTGEEHISLNPHKNKEIKDYILKILKINPQMSKTLH
ncbi:hypothetical protein HYW76_04370 [Candidatus Pacearchaeota archaeon]|nr:hypothetical protein [Candidatus Pacearchaeota archaeon]